MTCPNNITFSYNASLSLNYLSWSMVPLITKIAHPSSEIFSFPITFFFFFSSLSLWPHLWHMEVPRLGVELELQLPPYTAAPATWDLSCICKLCHSFWQCQILNTLSGQGWNPSTHRHHVGFLTLLSHKGKSRITFPITCHGSQLYIHSIIS